MLSHRGWKRATNEDSCGSFRSVLDLERSALHQRLARRRGYLFIVADGMGGHSHGELASAIAIEQICRVYYSGTVDDPALALYQAIQQANSAIVHTAEDQARKGLRPMGTTVVCAVVRGAQLTIANVGDSRAYLLRDGYLRRLTVDHSWTAEQMRHHGLNQHDAEDLALRSGTKHRLLRALGMRASARPDVVTLDWCAHDVLLLCSDGLHSQVTEPEIARLLAAAHPSLAVRELVRAANAAGGHDNSTCLVVRNLTLPQRWHVFSRR